MSITPPGTDGQFAAWRKRIEQRLDALATRRTFQPEPLVVRQTIDVSAPNPREQHLIPVPPGDHDAVIVAFRFDGGSNDAIVRLRCDGETSAALFVSALSVGTAAIVWKRPGGGIWSTDAGDLIPNHSATGELLELVLEAVDDGSPAAETTLGLINGAWFLADGHPNAEASEAGTIVDAPFFLTP